MSSQLSSGQTGVHSKKTLRTTDLELCALKCLETGFHVVIRKPHCTFFFSSTFFLSIFFLHNPRIKLCPCWNKIIWLFSSCFFFIMAMINLCCYSIDPSMGGLDECSWFECDSIIKGSNCLAKSLSLMIIVIAHAWHLSPANDNRMDLACTGGGANGESFVVDLLTQC